MDARQNRVVLSPLWLFAHASLRLPARLRRAPVAVRFVTNTTKECKRTLMERLCRLHFDIQEREIFTSLSAARGLVEGRALRPLLLLEDSALEDFSGEHAPVSLPLHWSAMSGVAGWG